MSPPASPLSGYGNGGAFQGMAICKRGSDRRGPGSLKNAEHPTIHDIHAVRTSARTRRCEGEEVTMRPSVVNPRVQFYDFVFDRARFGVRLQGLGLKTKARQHPPHASGSTSRPTRQPAAVGESGAPAVETSERTRDRSWRSAQGECSRSPRFGSGSTSRRRRQHFLEPGGCGARGRTDHRTGAG